MKTHLNRTKIAAAVSALAAGMALAPAYGMELASNGLGEVAETAYYTVRSGFQTNISIVNTSSDYVVSVKVRFHEAANSRDVRDFNLYLSPNDIWTGTLGMNADGKTPFLRTNDQSCTAPYLMPKGTPNTPANRQAGFVQTGTTSTGGIIKQIDFTNSGYINGPVAQNWDGGSTAINRSQEGYVEIIEMGVALPRSPLNPRASELAAWAVHGAGQNCASLANVWSGGVIEVTGSLASTATNANPRLRLQCNLDVLPTYSTGALASEAAAFQAEFCEPLSVLKVASNLVRVNTGIAMGVPTTMVANFKSRGNAAPVLPYNVVVPAGTENQNQPNAYDIDYQPSLLIPDLTYGEPAVAREVFNGTYRNNFFGNSVDAFSSLLMATEVDNEYRAAASGNPQTAWVLSFPTKAYYVDYDSYGRLNPAPFGEFFTAPSGALNGKSCFQVQLTYFNAEEGSVPTSVPPSPYVPGQNGFCWEAQTMDFSKAGNVFGSQFHYGFALQAGYTQGWAALSFPQAGTLTSVSGTVFRGLPVAGFALSIVPNGTANAPYTTPHAYERSIN